MKPSVKIYNRTKSTRIRKKHYKLIEGKRTNKVIKDCKYSS